MKITSFLFRSVLVCLLATVVSHAVDESVPPSMRLENNPYVVRVFKGPDGRMIVEERVPPSPPPRMLMPTVYLPSPSMIEGVYAINTINNVPAFTWCYGCSATSAAMLMGYYDNGSFPNMYTGPANGGVCPMNNVTYWGSTTYPGGTCGECPISATHNGIDGRSTKGHVDDYWVDIESAAQDPYITGSWTAHSDDCTADFMGTSRSAKSNIDGSTTFYYTNDGSPLHDYTGAEPAKRDGAHGMKLYVESCGYSVASQGNFNQRIAGYNGVSAGFTFNDYKAEVDAGRPVLIHVVGHTMLGVGYDDSGQKVYLHDTWDHSQHNMIWAGMYGTMQHTGVSVLRLGGSGPPPPPPSGALKVLKLKGTVLWKSGVAGKGHDTLKLSIPTTINDLSCMQACASDQKIIGQRAGATRVWGSLGNFQKMNGKGTSCKLQYKSTSSKYSVKSKLKLKDGTLYITRKLKFGDNSDHKYDVTNVDGSGSKTVAVTLDLQPNGNVITGAAPYTVSYRTKCDKKTTLK
jgi:hypothetical protein